jgi:hypothetical protein
MIFRVALLFIFLFELQLITAQTSRFTRLIKWHQPVLVNDSATQELNPDLSHLDFDHAVFPDARGNMPVYHEIIPLPENDLASVVRLENPVYIPLTPEELELAADYLNLPETLSWSAKPTASRGKNMILLNVSVLKWNSEHNTIEKLLQFEVVVDKEPILLKDQVANIQSEPAWSSVLAAGKWYKIKIYHDGIYKLNYADIQEMGFSDPSQIRIYGNGGSMLPLMNDEPRMDDLVENSIYMNKGADGIFNAGDYILFYGKGPLTWKYNPSSGMFEHQLNRYSRAAYYFLTTEQGSGKKILPAAPVTDPPSVVVTSFDDHDYHEKERVNFLKSGRQWFGERIDYDTFDTTFVFKNIRTTSPVKIKINVVSRSANTKTFFVKTNTTTIGTLNVGGVILSNYTGTYANQKSGQFIFTPVEEQVNVNISYNKTASSDEGFLDYITVNARRDLILDDDILFFRDISSVNAGQVAQFRIEGCNASTQIWDITDHTNISKVNAQLNGSSLIFSAHADSLREYVAVNTTGNFEKPVFGGDISDVGPVANQDLHATGPYQMLIVTHPLFLEAADSIAEFHRQHDNLSVIVATTDQVYNEFSSGARDVAAIRDFSRMIYNRASDSDNLLKYLLLLGDGSYNNLSDAPGNSNFIPTYQSESSLNASTSYVSDDFFGFMDPSEGGSDDMEAFLLDLGVGRLPAKTASEAMILFRKVKNYNSAGNMTDWRNNILFVGDDEDDNLHMRQANELADWMRANHPEYVIKKVLLDAYKQVSTSTGARYPDVNRIITDNINKGILIYNYTGHGGERGMAAEQILMREDLVKLSNASHLPLFVTATCEFSRFDDLMESDGTLIESTSAGETSLLNEKGGSIALLSTTRIVYSDRNHYLNTKFYKVAFVRDETGNFYRLGDIIRMTKDSTGNQRNKLNFILLGDPALTLNTAKYKVVTDSVNGTEITSPIDTLKALSLISISGHLESTNGEILHNFNGIIFPSVYDKARTITTLANDGGDPLQFVSQENLIYKGKASVRNGYYRFEFQVPKDISYSFGQGKVVYYAENQAQEANGSFSEFTIGGTSISVSSDYNGPEIFLYMNDENFNNGGITNTSPVIYALISDESGINMVGNGIGHDITGIIDNKISDPVVLNDYFESDLDNFKSGSLRYQLNDLAVGWHSLTVKAWDIFNNSSEETITFNVLPSEKLIISELYNFPNPATSFTRFVFEHNMPGEQLEVTINIYDMEGRLVGTISQPVVSSGFQTTPLEWNLKDMQGNMLRQGIYPYRVRVTDSKGSFAESYHKLVVVKQ